MKTQINIIRKAKPRELGTIKARFSRLAKEHGIKISNIRSKTAYEVYNELMGYAMTLNTQMANPFDRQCAKILSDVSNICYVDYLTPNGEFAKMYIR